MAINEGGRFSLRYPRRPDPKKTKEEIHKEVVAKQEDELFQTARLVTCGLYINFILNDYLRTIVNLNRVDTTWTLDPRFDPDKIYNPDGTPSGCGNMVSVEFNLVYRWHSCISKRDDEWTKEFYASLFPGKDPKTVGMREFMTRVAQWEESIPEDPGKRTFGGLERQENGGFKDDDLVRVLTESIEDVAGKHSVARLVL